MWRYSDTHLRRRWFRSSLFTGQLYCVPWAYCFRQLASASFRERTISQCSLFCKDNCTCAQEDNFTLTWSNPLFCPLEFLWNRKLKNFEQICSNKGNKLLNFAYLACKLCINSLAIFWTARLSMYRPDFMLSSKEKKSYCSVCLSN